MHLNFGKFQIALLSRNFSPTKWMEQFYRLCSTMTPGKGDATNTTLSTHLINETWHESDEVSPLLPGGDCKISLLTLHAMQGNRQHLKLRGGMTLQGHFFSLGRRGHFLKMKSALFCLLQNNGGT